MPDISMCPSQDCPVHGDCYRNEASGTRPCEWRQAWMAFTWRQPGGIGSPVECKGYWPLRARLASIRCEAPAPRVR